MVTKGEMWWRGYPLQEFRINKYTLFMRQITNKDVWCITRNSIQYSMITYMRKESKQE